MTVFTVIFISCATTKSPPQGPEPEDTAHVFLDTMTIHSDTADEITYEYRPAEDRDWDLLHTMLELSFDWVNSSVIGTATLTLTPVFYSQSVLKLDAVDFDIRKIMIGDKVITDFKYDSNVISLQLEKPFPRRERLTLKIEYTATPKASISDEGAPITSDKGLYFIDPLDTIPDMPRQIWTQGETSSNRKWFPTLDQPNERATQEIFLTVADTFMTLSNGSLISSTSLPGGLRRDHWKLELPSAPYLAMIAVGKWDKVSDYWRGRPVDYYVDPGYGEDARAIFAHTPEMIEFFSQKLGFDFVWPKYAQVIVKQFVSGAMENTTATIFADFIQFHEADMVESGSNDYIVAHELFHHWFGDLVTCESWANLTLNEGFANYAEYLWYEYKYGRERADISRMSELSGYFDQTAFDAHPLIYYHYADERVIFDAHSYNKGGLVLHMLRDLVGDEAFFASLRLYLQQHAYAAVEAHDLRQAFEEVTGKDLNWFFDQWYFSKGHPVLDVKQIYDPGKKQVNVEFTQTQVQLGYKEAFTIPIDIGIYYPDGKYDLHQIWLKDKIQSFSFSTKEAPSAVVTDPRDILLAVVNQDVPESELENRLLYTPSISHRLSAFRMMKDISDPVMQTLVKDSSYTMRAMAVQYYTDHENAEQLYSMSLNEADPEIQYFILESLASLDPVKAKELAIRILEKTDKNPIIYLALMAIASIDVDEALKQATRFEQNSSSAIYAVRAELYAKKGSGASLHFFKDDRARQLPLDYLEGFVVSLIKYISSQNQAIQTEGLQLLNSEYYLQGPGKEYRRFYLILGLVRQYNEQSEGVFKTSLHDAIRRHYAKETSQYLKDALKEGLGDLVD